MSINHFLLENYMWVRVSENVTSFGFLGNQRDIHFSISHHPNDQYINFHITKNTSPEYNKPKYEVVRIDKKNLEGNTISLHAKLLDLFYEQISIQDLNHGNTENTWFISTDDFIIHLKYTEFENGFFQAFKEISILKGTRKLRISNKFSEIESRISSLSPSLEPIFEQAGCANGVKGNGVLSGFLFSNDFIFSALYISGNWYRKKENIQTQNLFANLFGTKCYNVLKFRLARGIILVNSAKNMDDIKNTKKFILGINI